MRIAVTGCSGSIGRRVVLLAKRLGHSVVGIDIADPPVTDIGATTGQFSYHKADLTVYEDTLEALKGCEAIVHLGAIRTPEDYLVQTHNTNVVASWNVLRGAAELGIYRVAQASSVNVVPLIFSKEQRYDYFPIDEDHPCLPDEPYGLSKLTCEMQASTLVRRYPEMRIASIRLPWSLSRPEDAGCALTNERLASKHLWSWVHEDSVAEAFLLALEPSDKWSGHEAFFVASPETTVDVPSMELRNKFFPQIRVKAGRLLQREGFFDCGKAARLLSWRHQGHENC